MRGMIVQVSRAVKRMGNWILGTEQMGKKSCFRVYEMMGTSGRLFLQRLLFVYGALADVDIRSRGDGL
jgi:hypothetical protein